MNIRRSILTIFVLIIAINISAAQTEKKARSFSLEDVISTALQQSPDAYMAKHKYRASYWQYKSHKAEFLPSLNMNATVPDFNRAYSSYLNQDGSQNFVENRYSNSSVKMDITQNIGFTGGKIFIDSDLLRIDNFTDTSNTARYLSTPLRIGIMQPILSFNSFKWDKKVEPLKYEKAKKDYIADLEKVSIRATNLFFDLADAQINLEISKTNYFNNDTLLKIANGRYNMGTIAKNELLQMELGYLNSDAAYKRSELNLEVKKARLRSFLGYNNTVDIELSIPMETPKIVVDLNKAHELAFENNPEIIDQQTQLINAQRNVARTRAENRFNANLYASYGLSRSADDFDNVYSDPTDQQTVSFGIQVPIIDWGKGKGHYKMAQSEEELVKSRVEQARIDFEQNIYLKVMQFNMQEDQVFIASKADTIGMFRYEVTKQQFLIGKTDILNLNTALQDKDRARVAHINAIRNYWIYYFTIRQLTLYDFENNQTLETNYEELIN